MENKKLAAISNESIRNIVDTANELGIQKDDIVTIIKGSTDYIMVFYYKY